MFNSAAPTTIENSIKKLIFRNIFAPWGVDPAPQKYPYQRRKKDKKCYYVHIFFCSFYSMFVS